MPTTAWEDAARAELFVRSDLPTAAERTRRTIVARLEHLVATSVLDEFSVTSWAKRVPVDDDSAVGRLERDAYAEFDEWARTAGVRLDPFFDTRECYSSTTGDRRTELVLPAACLVLYDDHDDVTAVVPHATETETVSIAESLDRLADGDDDRPMTVTVAD